MLTLCKNSGTILIITNKTINKIRDSEIVRYMFNLLIETNSIRLKEIARLILDILNGSLKIDSSIIGRSNEYFSRIYTLKLISFCSGNSPKYLKGVDINNPTIISIARSIIKDFQSNIKNALKDKISI